MIHEKKIESMQKIDLVYKQSKYPQSSNPFLSRCFFISLFVGARSSGKTYSCVQLLKQYEKAGIKKDSVTIPQKIVLFSPTVSANPVFTSLKYLHEDDIHTKYSDAKLVKVIKQIQEMKEEIKQYKEDMKVYNRFLKKKKLTQDEVFQLEKWQFEPPQKPECGVEDFVVHLVLDDLLGSEAFKSIGKSALTELCLKNRHLGINILILCQNLKGVPKSIRINTSVFVIFKFANKRVIEDLYEEVESTMTQKQFEDLLDHATEGEHHHLTIDFTVDKLQRFKRDFDTVLIV